MPKTNSKIILKMFPHIDIYTYISSMEDELIGTLESISLVK